jgi:hypothetical protein
MDASGLAVSYVYYEEEPGRRAAANLMMAVALLSAWG